MCSCLPFREFVRVPKRFRAPWRRPKNTPFSQKQHFCSGFRSRHAGFGLRAPRQNFQGGWPNGLASTRKFNVSSKKAISVQPCTRTRIVLRETLLKPTCVDLRWVAKRLKTCVRLRESWSSTQVDVSHHKPSQVHACRGQTESQVTTSLQLVVTCDSVWRGFKVSILESKHLII